MFKSGKPVIIVDSVERAVKFYTEKLLFDVVDLKADREGELHLSYAELRKGKCYMIVRLPAVAELAEFSMVRRCSGRSVGIFIEIKKNIDRFHDRCRKKGVPISTPLSGEVGNRSFVVKDQFGIFFLFSEASSPIAAEFNPATFVGFDMKGQVLAPKAQAPDELIKWLRGFSITRRVAKKFIKVWAKRAEALRKGKKA